VIRLSTVFGYRFTEPFALEPSRERDHREGEMGRARASWPTAEGAGWAIEDMARSARCVRVLRDEELEVHGAADGVSSGTSGSGHPRSRAGSASK